MRPPFLQTQRLAAFCALGLGLLLAASVAFVWSDDAWAWVWTEAGVFLLAALWAVVSCWTGGFSGRKTFHWNWQWLVLGGAPVAIGLWQLQTGRTANGWATAEALRLWGAGALAMWLSMQIFTWGALRRVFLRGLLLFGFLFSVAGVVGYLSEPGSVFGVFRMERPGAYLGTFSNRDHYAAWMELLIPLALSIALRARRERWIATVVAGMMFASVITGASRAGSFLVTAEVLVVVFLVFRQRCMWPETGTLRTAAVLLICLIGFTAATGWNTLWERFHMQDPYQGRREMLIASRGMVRERPLHGFGLGTFEVTYPAYAVFDDGEVIGHAHNDWVEWAVEGGVGLSLALLVGVLGSAPLAIRSVWGIGVLSVMAHCGIDFPMHIPALHLWTCTLLGVVFAQESKRAREP